jgi:glycine cleavage system H lipoate-binding protein
MAGHDPYVLKAIEYLLGIGFLVCFGLFWKYAMGGRPAAAPAPARRRAAAAPAPMFRVPDDVMVHAGHGWARAEAPDLVAVGLDDFARQLLGPVRALSLPPVGAALEQGTRGWRLAANGKAVDMLSPVTGRVAAVNTRALENPQLVNDDPFGRGWLIKVQTSRLVTDAKQLLGPALAKRLNERSWEELSALFTPELGTIMHDGGVPVNGFARGVDPDNWDRIARRFLLT